MSKNDLEPMWDLLNRPEVHSAIERAARKIAAKAGSITTEDDLLQEAYIFAATKADLRKSLGEKDGLRRFQHGLEMDLIDSVKTPLSRSEMEVPDADATSERREEKPVRGVFEDLDYAGFRGGSGAESGPVVVRCREG